MDNLIINFFEHSLGVTVTSSFDTVVSWINRIEYIHNYSLPNLVVGLDIEWRPNMIRNSSRNRVSVLQLCVGHYCLVYQLYHAHMIPRALADFLSNGNYTFVGVGIDDDVQKLKEDYGLEVYKTVDLRNLASNRWNQPAFRSAGLATLANSILDMAYTKPHNITISDWSQPALTVAQAEYAAIDAFLSFEIGNCLCAAQF